MTLRVRPARPDDIPALAGIWHDGWHEAHAADVPAALTALRTLPDFIRRLHAMGDDLRVAGPIGAPIGFCAILKDELYQLYVAPAGRGTGLAACLVADAEARIAQAGHKAAHLACGLENNVAAGFYRRQGWTEEGVVEVTLDTSTGPFPLPIRRFVKPVLAR